MQRLTHNSQAPTLRRRPRALIVYLLVLSLATPFPLIGQPASVGEITSLTSFKALMLVIANLNRAMESAAQNPQDDWRRQDAARAFSALPPAIIGLAKDFKAGKLGNEDLPMVQAMLGGFVNKNAADNFKQFMKSPNKTLIPQVSSQLAPMLPKVSSPATPAGAMLAANAKAGAPAPSGPVEAANPQVVSLSDPSLMAGTASPGTAAGKDQSQSISYDESAKQKATPSSGNVAAPTTDSGVSAKTLAAAQAEFGGGSSSDGSSSAASGSASRGLASNAAPAQARPATVGEAISDLQQMEANLVASPAGASAPVAVKEDPDKAQFFAKMKLGGDESQNSDDEDASSARRTKKKASRRPASTSQPHSELAPKYFNVRPLVLFAESLLIQEAHAEGGESGGKDGGSAGDILYGLAAIMAAAAPIAVASIQANADKYIAKTNADAQIQMTNITSDTSKYLADQQKSIALQQADIAQAVNKSNNDYVTQRLQMQLGELSNARHEAEAAEQQKLAIEQQYNNQRIQLAQQQADQNVKLAQQTLNAQLTQLGLTSGAVNSNATNRLTTSSGFAGGGVSIGASAGTVGQQTQGLVAAAPGGSESAVGSATRGAEMTYGSAGLTNYNLGAANGAPILGSSAAAAPSGGVPFAAGAGGEQTVQAAVAPQSGLASPFSANRGAVMGGAVASSGDGSSSTSFSASGGSDSLGDLMKDFRSAGDTSGIGAPAPTQELVQGDLSKTDLNKGNEALLASVHQPGGESTRALHPRDAGVGNSVFESVGTVADARGNRGGKRGAGNRGSLGRRLSSRGAGRPVAYTPDQSRILNYLRDSVHTVNGSTNTNHNRILSPNSDLGLFTSVAAPRGASEGGDDFVRFREKLAQDRAAGSSRGASRAPASVDAGSEKAPAASGHKRQQDD